MTTHCNADALSQYSFPPGTRNARLPKIYTAQDHPLHPSSNPGATYVVKIRPTVASMEEAEQFEQSLNIPRGQKEELDGQGLLEMRPGDYLFGRNEFGSGKAEDDVLIAWTVGGGMQDQEDRDRLDRATNRALGPRVSRTRDFVHMERFFNPVKDDARCYNVASSLERQPGIVAPTAQLKDGVHEGEVSGLSHDLTEAIAPMAMRNMEQAPPSVQDAIRTRTETMTLPRIGGDCNWAYQALQCNVASVPEDSSGDLSQQMGFFGGAHFDDGDSPAHYTNMITNSQLPPDYDPGYFHLLAFGVYVRLSNHGGFNFQGNRKHGGSGPFPPSGETPPPHAYRFNLVSYPPHNMMNPRTTRWRMALGSGGEPVFMMPEMRAAEYIPPSPPTGNSSATFFQHSHMYMDRLSQAKFCSRSLYDMCRYFVNQISPEVGFTIDPDEFLGAFRYRDEAHQLQRAPHWDDALPTEVDKQSGRGIAARGRRRSALGVWNEHYSRTAGLIPSRFMREPELRAAVNSRNLDDESGAQSPEARDSDVAMDDIEQGAGAGDIMNGSTLAGGPHSGKRKRGVGVTEGPGEQQLEPGVGGGASGNSPRKRQKSSAVPRIVTLGNSSSQHAGPSTIRNQGGGKGEKTGGTRKGEKASGAGKDGKASGAGKGEKAGDTGKDGKACGSTKRGERAARTSRADVAETKYTFLFNRQTTREVLEMEVQQVARELQACTAGSGAPRDLDTLIEVVSAAQREFTANPCGLNTPTRVNTLLEHIDVIETTLGQHNLVARKGRSAVVEGRCRIWRWLEHDLPQATREVLRGKGRSTRGGGWLGSLVQKLKSIFQLKTASFSFRSSNFSFHPKDRDVSVVFQNKRHCRNLSGEALEESVVDAVTEVVRGWLRYTDDQDRRLLWFVLALEEELGEEIVTMDHTWKMISHFKSTYVVSGSHPERATDDSAAFTFRKELSQHPISTESTRENALYREYQGLLQGKVSPVDVSVAGKSGDGWAKYLKMWRTAQSYVASTSSPARTRYHRALRDDPDAFLPIREKAPGRVRATQADGPYADGTIQTVGGIFSAVVFRSITYRSLFFYNQRMVFDSWQDYSSFIDGLCGQPDWQGMTRRDQYFCLDAPYGGRPNPQRNVELAEQYWASVKDRRWPAFCSATPKPTFAQMLRYFDPKRKESNIFPQLGNLSSMSLVCDLAYSSVCEMPTIQEMAECITSWNSGSLKGLQLLGLVDVFPKGTKRPEKVRAVVQALQEVWDFLSSKLSKEEQEEIGLDVIVLEHSLWFLTTKMAFKFKGSDQYDL